MLLHDEKRNEITNLHCIFTIMKIYSVSITKMDKSLFGMNEKILVNLIALYCSPGKLKPN